VHFVRRRYLHLWLTMVLAGLLVVTLLATSGSFLIVNQPRRSDVIVILAGETEKRPARGLELLSQGFAPRLILDVPADTTIYQWSQLELAQKYVESLPQAVAVSLCPIHALSTKGEAQEVSGCLEKVGVRRVLLVTSDFHTRRTRSTFKRLCPQYDFSVAAAFDEREFGAKWWRRRQWAKVNFDEWIRLVWWQLVDRWR
jgi:uncharacterized SAM-binding protein YcdF (DUF218 family)